MARILGVDIPDNKRIEIALTYIFGIGDYLSKKILKDADVDVNIRSKDLDDAQVARIRSAIDKLKLPVEGELRRMVGQNIRRLQEIKSYRGDRHRRGLPVRGQRTHTNARTRKGPAKTIAGKRK